MTLKFYMTPGSCSTGIHILLEELELPFEVTILNLPAGEHRQPAYLAINPKGTIPALVLPDGYVLTEFQAIAFWLAQTYPAKGLLPVQPGAAAAVLELLEYVVGTIHGQGYTRIFTSETYLPAGLAAAERDTWQPAIQARGHELVEQGFGVVEKRLSVTGWVLEQTFTIADVALFYVAFWADHIGMALPARVAAHYQRMRARPKVRQVLLEEGYR